VASIQGCPKAGVEQAMIEQGWLTAVDLQAESDLPFKFES
jgi:hypothetical protein